MRLLKNVKLLDTLCKIILHITNMAIYNFLLIN